MIPTLPFKMSKSARDRWAKQMAEYAASMKKTANPKDTESLAMYAYKIAYTSAFDAFMATAVAKDGEEEDVIMEAVVFARRAATQAYDAIKHRA